MLQIMASKNITPELASQAISTVKRLIGEAAGVKLTQFLKPLVNVGPNFEPNVQVEPATTKPGTGSGIQLCHFFVFYIPLKLWDLY